MSKITIVADENIPFVRDFFSGFGDVHTFPGRTLNAEQVRHADVLLVRSVTTVDAALLDGSQVKFIGTCTIGVDHLDTDYLESRNISFNSAPGCNANSVVEYIFSALARHKPEWLTASVGIIGCGNVGGHLYRQLQTLGVSCRVFDPFLCEEDVADLTSLEQVLNADVVCLHTPLTVDGDHPTEHLLGEHELSLLRPETVLINAGRGPVIDNAALLKVLKLRPDLRVVLDVWEHEPQLDPNLLTRVHGGSPHIAGYSLDGKVEGTAMIYRALCQQLGQDIVHQASDFLPVVDSASLAITGASIQDVVNQAILAVYDVAEDDQHLRQCVANAKNADILGVGFDQLRKGYRQRRECSSYSIAVAQVHHWSALDEPFVQAQKKSLNKLLATVGFSQEKRE